MEPSNRKDKNRFRIAAGLLLLTVLLYAQTTTFDFIHFDEEQYVTRNIRVLSGLTWGGVQWAFTTLEGGFWHPLTWLSLMADAQLYGVWAGGYHLTNVLLHLLNTLLLFWVLTRMTGSPWRSGLVGALFALHPLHVESVAWIAQRKDVLSTFFWMLTLLFYVRYTERPGWFRYGWVLLAYVLGLMSKPMLVTLPFVLLLLDVWPLRRWRIGEGNHDERIGHPFFRLALEKAPLLMLGVLFGLLTYFAEDLAGALPGFHEMPLSVRVANALVSYGVYLLKTVWPVDLAAFYPHPGIWPWWQVLLAGSILVLASGWILYRMRTLPFLFVGWFWFLGTLVPVVGLIQVGSHGMADRYTYIPLIGWFIALVWWASEGLSLLPDRKKKGWGGGIALVLILGCFVLSWQQLQHWRNSIALFSHAIASTRNNYLAYNNLGGVLLTYGDADAAEGLFRKALQIKPDYPAANNNLGNVMLGKGRLDEAILYFKKALHTAPAYGNAYRNLGDAYLRKGDFGRAISSYKSALIYGNQEVHLYNNMGVALTCLGRYEEAMKQFERVLMEKPDDALAAANLRKIGAGMAKRTSDGMKSGADAKRGRE